MTDSHLHTQIDRLDARMDKLSDQLQDIKDNHLHTIDLKLAEIPGQIRTAEVHLIKWMVSLMLGSVVAASAIALLVQRLLI